MMRKAMTALVCLLALSACKEDNPPIQGYVEGDYLRVGLPSGGRMVSLLVEKGQRVQAGEPLFALDDREEQASLAQAQAQLEQARFQRDNLLTGKRVLEIKAIEEQKAQAQADLTLSQTQLRRQEELIRTGNTPQASLDSARSAVNRDRARVAELAAQLAFAHEGGREAEIHSAQATVSAAEAALAQAQWKLDERTAKAPKAALVDDILFRPGEVLTANQAGLSLLPPDHVKLRMYLSPELVGRVSNGQKLAVSCEGCPPGLTASVRYVAPEAGYAPPVIYSRDNRAKLVFLVEAQPDSGADTLRPGQPVSLVLP